MTKCDELPRLRAEVEAIRELFYPHERAQAVHADLEILLARDNRGSEGAVLTLLGDSRSGKTRVLRAFQHSHPAVPGAIRGEDGTVASRIEVASMRVPRTGRKTFFQRLISVLTGMPESRVSALGGREHDLQENAIQTAQKVGLKLLLLEEAHQSVQSKGKTAAEELATALKDVTNESCFSLAVSGTDAARRLFELNEELEGRVLFEHELTPLDWASPGEQKLFCDVLGMIDEHLRDNVFGKLSGLAGARLARPLLTAARGHIGHAATLLEVAGYRAVQDMLDGECGKIEAFHLAEALASSPLRRHCGGNPFPATATRPNQVSDGGTRTNMTGRTRQAGQDVNVRR